MRTYRKRTPTLRHCVHCHAPFESAHKRRIYCGNSCSTLAYYARKAHAATANSPLPAAETALAGTVPPAAESPATNRLALDWNVQNFAVLGGASFLAQVGVSVSKRLLDAFLAPREAPRTPLPAGRAIDPLDWLPVGLLTSAAPRVSLPIPALNQSFVCVQLTYLGHPFFYQPTHRVLLWQVAPGQFIAVLKAQQLALIAELPVYEEVRQLASPVRPVGTPKYVG